MFESDKRFFFNKFKEIVNKIYEEQIEPYKRKKPINEHDMYDLRMVIGLGTVEVEGEEKIDFDKFLENFKKYC